MTQVSLINQSLGLLNVNTINSIDEDSKGARKAKLFYETTLKALMRSKDWNFAIRRTVLSSDPEAPEWGFGKKFALPVDFLKFVESDRDEWASRRIEGNFVLSDETTAMKIRYVAYIEDDSIYDAMFSELFTYVLALKLWKSLSGDKPTRDVIKEEMMEKFGESAMVDAYEDTPENYLEPDEQDLVAARTGW